MQLTEQQIKTAAEWWANSISHPVFDNGDSSRAGGITSILAIMATKPVTPAQIENFKVLFANELRQKNPTSIRVDYGPEALLGSTMVKAGIDPGRAPWKSFTKFVNGGIEARLGYDGSREYILKCDPVDADIAVMVEVTEDYFNDHVRGKKVAVRTNDSYTFYYDYVTGLVLAGYSDHQFFTKEVLLEEKLGVLLAQGFVAVEDDAYNVHLEGSNYTTEQWIDQNIHINEDHVIIAIHYTDDNIKLVR